MPRARLEPGQLGTIGFTILASGAVQATAKMRDEMGELQRLKASGATEDEARAAVEKQAELIRFRSVGPILGKDATIAEACKVFMHDKTAEGLVEDTTLETYQFCIDNVIAPQCGALRLRDLSVLRCNRILQSIREEKSLSSARKAKSVLSMVCATGIEHEVIAVNPVRDTRRLPLPEKKESALTPTQVIVVRDLMRAWRKDGTHHGPRPNVALLENAMWIMIGTSCRIGEVLGLRRCDIDVTMSPATVLVDATIKQSKRNGLYRKNAPKRSRQKRRLTVPSYTAAALRHQLAVAGRDAENLLFATATGRPMSVSNYERLLRTFVNDNWPALHEAGVDTDEFTTHLFRRSTATIVEAVAGITVASRMLGHADEQVTRRSYVVTAEAVDPITAEIMDAAFEGLF